MRLFKYLLLFLFTVSCTKTKEIREENKYQIINLIYNNFSNEYMTFFVFPARPSLLPDEDIDYRRMLNDKTYMDSLHKIKSSNKISKTDSLFKIKKYTDNKENQQIFAIDLKMEKYHNLKNRELQKNKTDFENLYKKFVASEKIDSLNIHNILPKNNDSIIPFRKELLKDKVGVGFRKFNILVSFSNIVFNNSYSKAILISTRAFSGTDAHSLIYFLEKEDGKWEKVFEEIP